MKSTFARRISILLVLAMVLAMLPLGALAADSTTLYLQPNENWLKDGARFAAYFFGNGETWVSMTDADADGIYEVEAPTGYPSVIFCRMNPANTTNNWNNKWNQTADLTVPTDGNNLYTVAAGTWDKGNGTWSAFTPGDVVTTPTAAPKNFDYYVAGSFNGWNECSDDYGMTVVDGVYSLTLTLAAGTYTFKVTDGTWTNSWGLDGGSSNYEFVLDAEAAVTITFDAEAKKPAVTSSAMGEVTIYDYYLTGEMNGWTVNSSECGLTANGDGTYSITVDMVAGTYEYKFTNGTWDVCFPAGTDNATLTVDTDCAVTFTLNPVDGTFTATGDGVGETPVDPPVDITSVNVKGNFGGLDFDETSTAGAMTLVDGIYTITIPAVPASVEGGEQYKFKVMVNNSWDNAYPESDWLFYLNAECDVTITYNPTTNAVELFADGLTYDAPPYGEDPIDPPVGEKNYYVAGSMNDWTANAEGYVMTDNGDGTFTFTFTALAAGSYSLKVTDGTWTNSWTAAEGSEYMDASGNLSFTVTAACDVVVTFDGTSVSVAGENVTAKAPEKIEINKVVIAGGVAGDGTADPGNMFNGLIWAVGEEILVNKMYDNNDGIYTITFSQVLAGSYEFKFVVNDSWDLSFASGLEVTPGVEETAWFAALGNSTVVVTEDGSTVTFVLDLSEVVYTGDNAKMTVNVEAPASIKENAAPEQIVIGDNEFAFATGNREPVTAPYTATYTGTLYIYPTAMTVINWMGELEEVPSEAINMQFGRMYGIMVDGMTVWGNQIEVVEGQTYQIGIMDNMGAGCMVTLTVCSGHNFVDGTCSVCGYVCSNHNWDEGVCLICGETCAHENWDGGWCTNCWMSCEHSWAYTYTKNGSHTFTCSGICGASVSVADVDGQKFGLKGASPVLSDDIIMVYETFIPTGFSDAYMVFEFNGETIYVFESEYVESSGRTCFRFPGLNPQKMGDNISATLYAYVDGMEVSIVNAKYSMVQYCDTQLKKSTISAELRTALSDLLIYGEMNQIYEGYKLDALCTTLLSPTSTLTPSTFPAEGVDASWNVQGMTGTKLDDCTFTGVGVTLGAKIVIGVNVTCTDIERFSFKVTIGGVDHVITGDMLESTGVENKYVLNFDKITAIQLGETITFTIWEGDTQVSRTATYSVYTYIYRNQNAADTNLVNLLKAIYNYGESVKKL